MLESRAFVGIGATFTGGALPRARIALLGCLYRRKANRYIHPVSHLESHYLSHVPTSHLTTCL